MSFTISRKLFFILALATTLLLVTTIIGALKIGDAIEQERAIAVKHQVEGAITIVNAYADRAVAGDMTLQAAQEAAKAAVGAIRYGENDYFFVVDRDRIGLVHPNPDIIGRDLTDVADQNGVLLFQDLVNRAAAGGDYTAYAWPRAGSDIPVPKISYSAEFAPWGWVIATGVYLDDIQSQVWREVWIAIAETAIVFIVLFVGSILVSRSITKPVAALKTAIKKIEAGDLNTPIAATSTDEIGEITANLDRLRETLKAKAQIEQDAAARADDTKRVVTTLADRLTKLSNGRLDVQIMEHFPDGYEGLRQDFNEAMRTLQDLSRAIEDIADVVNANASEISQNTNHLAREAERTANALDETATSLEGVARTVTETAQTAGATDVSVNAARDRAKEGEVVIERTHEAMEKIKSSSAEIRSVTAVIEDIAFQTNLLALNAGVEAARAGDAGRGFLIVAQEVRNLAARCSDAVVTINGLVAQANQQVEDGASEFSQTREALQVIIASFDDIQTKVSEINAATQGQSASIAEVSHAVSGLRATTQQNAASLEENSAGSHQLQAEAEKLQLEVAKLNGGGASADLASAA